jgi:hypothetical protein
MKFTFPDGVVRRTQNPDGSPGKGAVMDLKRIYVYPEGHGYLFFKNADNGSEISIPFDGHYDAMVYLAGYLYKALKVAKE